MYTSPSLLKTCEELLRRDDCTMRLRTISEHQTTAKCTYRLTKDGPVEIVLTTDPAKGGLIECFLHEALHVVLADRIGEYFNTALDEVIIKALERELWMKFKKRDVERWRRLIEAKLAKN